MIFMRLFFYLRPINDPVSLNVILFDKCRQETHNQESAMLWRMPYLSGSRIMREALECVDKYF